MLMTWKISSIFSTVFARIGWPLRRHNVTQSLSGDHTEDVAIAEDETPGRLGRPRSSWET